jgi:SNF2 family DNA or RNA helicase
MAEKFQMPIITFIDTPGAYPGKEAEERGQAEAIARNLKEMIGIEVPILSVVIGEGGSGGALGIAVANRIMMLEYAVYSVISPEGCASILFRDASRAEYAAEKLKMTAKDIVDLGIADQILPEPLGGAHNNWEEVSDTIKTALLKELETLTSLNTDKIKEDRYKKFRSFGKFKELTMINNMKNHHLIFDEFDVKEHSTIEYLKKGKKAFNSGYIHEVSFNKNSITGTYKRGKVERKLKIKRVDSKLIGTINDDPVSPMTSPLTALAYWYINYINENKQITISESSKNNSLEPFNKLQTTIIYDAIHDKVNLTFYQPETQSFCDESHLFIYSFSQIIQEFDSVTQNLIQKLSQHFDETIFYETQWVKLDTFLSNHIILLIKNNVLYSKKHQRISINETDIHLKTTCKISQNQVITSFDWIPEGESLQIPIHEALQCNRSDYIVHNNTCYKITNPMHAKIAMQFKQSLMQRLDISKIKPFISKMVELRKKVGLELAIDANIQKLKEVAIKPVCKIDVKTSSTGGELIIYYNYNNVLIQSSNHAPYIIFDDFTYSLRDFDEEHRLRDVLLHYHPVSTEENSIRYESPYFDQIMGEIKSKELDNISFSSSVSKTILKNKAKVEPKIKLKKSSSGSLTLHLDWVHPNKEKLTNKLKDHINLGMTYFYDHKENQVIHIKNADILTELSKQHEIKIPTGIGIYIALNTDFDIDLPTEISSFVSQLKQQKKLKLSKQADNTLRSFQKDGLKWLITLYNSSFNGILADDMGLGKTIQSIFLLKSICKTQPNPTLIIMPKTLLFNWQKELKTFSPELNVLLYDGPKRAELIHEFSNADVICASYTSVRLDIKKLTQQKIDLLILDEAQYVKNHTTNTFKAIKKLKTKKRLLLTGTPLENNINDLWSLMEIANDDYFGSHKAFDEFYQEANNQPILKAAIQPFMLRRRKNDVLTDLPPITIQELWASPTPEEKKAYISFAQQEWQEIETIVEKKGLEKSKIHIFSLMTKLRQWCANPKLIQPENDNGPKWHLFVERLTEAIETGHKVVIFSQFIPMIETMEAELKKQEIPFVSLTGQTKNRANIVNQFNEDDQIRVGIFSLKAGGVGINLTSADYVFMYDPWWNPAVEQQAIDRVHRIGQDQPVMVFKCLVASTIEERMIDYQNQKKDLIQALIEDQQLSDLSLSEIKSLIGI